MRKTLMVFILVVSAAGTSKLFAAERIVDGVGGAASRYATIVAAVAAASTGDTIRVLSGLFTEAPITIT